MIEESLCEEIQSSPLGPQEQLGESISLVDTVLEEEEFKSPEEHPTIRHFRTLGIDETEIRAISSSKKGPKVYSDRFNLSDPDECQRLCDVIDGLSMHTEDAMAYQGIYAPFNRIESDFFGSQKKNVRDADVIERAYIFVDVDPERKSPADGKTCADEQELEAARKVMKEVLEVTRNSGFPDPYVVNSGNGYQAYYPTCLPNDHQSKKTVQDFLRTLAAKVDTDEAKVDLSVFNAGRISRIPGSYNRKSQHSETRPNRLVAIHSIPEDWRQEIVSREMIEKFIADHSQEKQNEKLEVLEFSATDHLDPGSLELLIDEIKTYVNENVKVPIKQIRQNTDITFIDLSYCPFRGPDHEDGNPAIMIYLDGSIGLKCFHAKCSGQTWDSLQAKVGIPFKSNVEGIKTNYWCDSIKRRIDDPLRLARVHVDKWRTKDGDISTAYLNGKLYRFTEDHGWIETSDAEIAPWVRDTIQEEFDKQAKWLSSEKGKPTPPKIVGNTIINNVIKALHDISKVALAPDAVPPYWFTLFEDWDPKDLQVFKNGILNFQKLLEGKPSFIPLTARLYYEQQAPFEYDPDARECPEWMSFLESLEQDAEWVYCLQEIMGYVLWSDFNLQKIVMFCGATRGGKGTIVRVLEQIAGGNNAVCGLDLMDFSKDFGLEKTIGKKLGTFNDIDMPTKNVSQVVAKLKAASGNDLISIDRKHRINISVKFDPKMLMVTNKFMPLPDNSGGLQTRLLPLKFTKSFFGNEDPQLGKKLEKEYPAILNWALEGLKRLVENGGKFTEPETTEELLRQLAQESAPIRSFVEECCDLDKSKAVLSSSVYNCYKQWAKEKYPDCPECNSKEFKQELLAVAPQLSEARASSGTAQKCKGSDIVRTAYDDPSQPQRPLLLLGVKIKEELPFQVATECAPLQM